MAWCFEDERMPQALEVLDRVHEYGAFVPQVWPLEVANTLLRAQLRGRITTDYCTKQISFLYTLSITPDEHTYDAAWIGIADLAAQHRLTSYDAAYLELALRRGLPLATLDQDLRSAAEKMGVELLGK